MSASSTDKAKRVFCEQISKFSKDIRVILPDDSEADMILGALDTMLTISPDLIVEFFKSQIAVPYKKEILTRNESFLSKELSKGLSENAGPLGNLHTKIIDRWGGMKESQKNAIWDYFKVLVLLSDRL